MVDISKQGYMRAFGGERLRLSKVFDNKHTVLDYFKSKDSIEKRLNAYDTEIKLFLQEIGNPYTLSKIIALKDRKCIEVNLSINGIAKKFEFSNENGYLQLFLIENSYWRSAGKRTLLRSEQITDTIENTNLLKTLVMESQNVTFGNTISSCSQSLMTSLNEFDKIDQGDLPDAKACGHFFFLGSGFDEKQAQKSEVMLQQAHKDLDQHDNLHSRVIAGPTATLGRGTDDRVIDGIVEILEYIKQKKDDNQPINLKIATHSRGGNIGLAAYNLAMKILEQGIGGIYKEDEIDEVFLAQIEDRLYDKELQDMNGLYNKRYNKLVATPTINVYFMEFDKVGGPNFINQAIAASNQYAKYLLPPPNGKVYYQRLISSLEDRISHNIGSLVACDPDRVFIRDFVVNSNHLHIVKAQNDWRGENHISRNIFNKFLMIDVPASSRLRGKDAVHKNTAAAIAAQTKLTPRRAAAIKLVNQAATHYKEQNVNLQHAITRMKESHLYPMLPRNFEPTVHMPELSEEEAKLVHLILSLFGKYGSRDLGIDPKNYNIEIAVWLYDNLIKIYNQNHQLLQGLGLTHSNRQYEEIINLDLHPIIRFLITSTKNVNPYEIVLDPQLQAIIHGNEKLKQQYENFLENRDYAGLLDMLKNDQSTSDCYNRCMIERQSQNMRDLKNILGGYSKRRTHAVIAPDLEHKPIPDGQPYIGHQIALDQEIADLFKQIRQLFPLQDNFFEQIETKMANANSNEDVNQVLSDTILHFMTVPKHPFSTRGFMTFCSLLVDFIETNKSHPSCKFLSEALKEFTYAGTQGKLQSNPEEYMKHYKYILWLISSRNYSGNSPENLQDKIRSLGQLLDQRLSSTVLYDDDTTDDDQPDA